MINLPKRINCTLPLIVQTLVTLVTLVILQNKKRLSFPDNITISSQCFDLLHMDIWGPYAHPSLLGHKYFLTIVDDKSRYTWIIFLKLKSEVSNHIKHFISMVETQFSDKVKGIRSDNDPEFALQNFYGSQGILHQTSYVETPQQNEVVERKHQHLLAVAKALLFHANLPNFFWTQAVSLGVHIINKLSTKFLNQKSPHEVLFNCTPSINTLRVFGCLWYASTLKANRKKFDARARKCVYLGVRAGVKGHLLFLSQNKRTSCLQGCFFYENIFPYLNSHSPPSVDSTQPIKPVPSSSYMIFCLICFIHQTLPHLRYQYQTLHLIHTINQPYLNHLPADHKNRNNLLHTLKTTIVL